VKRVAFSTFWRKLVSCRCRNVCVWCARDNVRVCFTVAVWPYLFVTITFVGRTPVVAQQLTTTDNGTPEAGIDSLVSIEQRLGRIEEQLQQIISIIGTDNSKTYRK